MSVCECVCVCVCFVCVCVCVNACVCIMHMHTHMPMCVVFLHDNWWCTISTHLPSPHLVVCHVMLWNDH